MLRACCICAVDRGQPAGRQRRKGASVAKDAAGRWKCGDGDAVVAGPRALDASPRIGRT